MSHSIVEKTFKVLPHMCKQQTLEMKQLISAADEIGAAATSVGAQGGQGYENLLEARENFKSILEDVHSHYRIFIAED